MTLIESMFQVLLRWAVQQNVLVSSYYYNYKYHSPSTQVIPRSTNQKHLLDNISVLNWELSADSMNQLNAICPPSAGYSGEKHFCWDPISIS